MPKLTSHEVTKHVKDVKSSKISKAKRAEILLLLASGNTYRDIRDNQNVAMETIRRIKKDNKDLLEQISNNLLDERVTQTQRLIHQYTDLLEIKARELRNNGDALTKTKASELSGVIKDLFTKHQLEEGKPTSINYSTKDVTELKLELKAILDSVENKKLDKNILELD